MDSRLVAVVVTAVLAGCSGMAQPDAGRDGGRVMDAAALDGEVPDAGLELDAGADAGVDAGHDAGAVDASRDAGIDAPACTLGCDLYVPTGMECPPELNQACRIHGCSTSCDSYAGSPLIADSERCMRTFDCYPGEQCLAPPSGGGNCAMFCRIGHDSDCDPHRLGATCRASTDLRTVDIGGPDDDVRVVLPVGFGVCY